MESEGTDDLRAGFLDEARGHLPTLHAAVAEVFGGPWESPEVPPVLLDAHRRAHSIKGAAAMLDLPDLSGLAAQVEDMIEDLADGRVTPGPAACGGLGEAIAALSAALDADGAVSGVLWVRSGETQRAWRERRHSAAPLVLPARAELEPVALELVSTFREEAGEHLLTLGTLLRQLEREPAATAALRSLRQTVHTLKGAASVVGYPSISQLAHRMEDLLEGLADRGLGADGPTLELLFDTADRFETLVEDDPGASGPPADLMERYQRALGVPQATDDGTLVGPDPTSGPLPSAAPAASVPTRAAATLRVPLDRLDDLVRLVGELVIHRASFEQHGRESHHQVGELRLASQRLRHVTQALERLVEAGSSLQPGAPTPWRSPAHAPEFDELELDRYGEVHLTVRSLAEASGDIATTASELTGAGGDFDTHLLRQARLTRDLQERLLRLRMVPLVTLASRLHRAVRVTAAGAGKDVELVLSGESVALDKRVLDEVADPLLHLVRNAVDHGIEPPAVRRSLGKPARGHVALTARQEGTEVLIEVSDDGNGLDDAAIRARAVERGLLVAAEAPRRSARELAELIFQPGFTTAATLSEVSGRGVGLDAVRSAVSRLGGTVTVTSEPGAGARFLLRLPTALTITRVLLVRAEGEVLAVPQAAVLRVVRLDASPAQDDGTLPAVIELDGRGLPLVGLANALHLPRFTDRRAGRPAVLVLNLAGREVALLVDDVAGAREVVVKDLGSLLPRLPGLAGATLTGNGQVLLVVDPPALAAPTGEEVGYTAPRAAEAARQVLIVDDSLSVRRVLSNLVRGAGWAPLTAKDGIEALEMLRELPRVPDAMLVDLEMPRLDGFELTAALRQQETSRHIPVVILTSRSGLKHRAKAFDAGASDYLVKPYRPEVLLATLERLAHERGAPAAAPEGVPWTA